MRSIVLALLCAECLFGQAKIFTQEDTAAAQCSSTEALACSGGTLAATPGSATMSVGGTAGSTADALQITDNAQRVIYWFESNAVNDTTWESGNYTVRVNITTADADGQWDNTHICRVNSDCSSVLGSVGSVTNQNTSLASTGVKTHTVSGSSQSANLTDLLLIVLAFEDTAIHGNMSTAITPNQNIDTPIVPPTPTTGGREGLLGNPITY